MMRSQDEHGRQVNSLVRMHLDHHANSVDAAAFVARLKRTRARRLRLRRLAIWTVAAAALIVSFMSFPSSTTEDPLTTGSFPPPPIRETVQETGRQALARAVSGLESAGGSVRRAVEGAASVVPVCLSVEIPKPDDETIRALKSDMEVIKEDVRQMVRKALGSAGLAS